ncbi:hypothetical protein PISMIDRAFT_16202 [Pisolithus microcarpus 441]|uniref:Uncharacterized protein n=1 Tax=Pisolithus microcarpus 441 TaxID=765257 RepID=A0A0C9Z0K3_9AGAM|nr:hypothetical protein PISMIDRAFT_16202 [Pisolithus microcarpus 441]
MVNSTVTALTNPSSPKEYATIDGLQKHLHQVKAPWIAPGDAAMHSVPSTEPVRGDIAMESLNIQEQQQGEELGQKHREGSYSLLSSDAVSFEEENGSAAEDCKGKAKAVEGWT